MVFDLWEMKGQLTHLLTYIGRRFRSWTNLEIRIYPSSRVVVTCCIVILRSKFMATSLVRAVIINETIVRLLARDAQAKLALIVAQILSICPSTYPRVCPRQLERSIARREPHRLPACYYYYYAAAGAFGTDGTNERSWSDWRGDRSANQRLASRYWPITSVPTTSSQHWRPCRSRQVGRGIGDKIN